MGSSLDRDLPIVVIDATTGRRHPYWAELERWAPDDAHRLLFVRPAKSFRGGHRYIVAIRNVVDSAGRPIQPSDVFRGDRLDTGIDAIDRPALPTWTTCSTVFGGPGSVVTDWCWPGISPFPGENLSERLLAMRDDAFGQLGRAVSRFTVTGNVPSTRANLAREVSGTFEVPNYLTGSGEPGAVLNNGNGPDSSPIPVRNGTYTARFICTIPTSAIGPDGGANLTRMMLYGHGLLGSAREALGASSRYARYHQHHDGDRWIGMSEEDIGVVLQALGDMSAFRSIPDRLQQSMLNFLFLGRLMKHPDGFSSDPALQAADGTPLLDQRNLTFNGVSQGGIRRCAHLRRPGLDAVVPRRACDELLDAARPERRLRPLQPCVRPQLSRLGRPPARHPAGPDAVGPGRDRNGYVQHLTDNPYRRTPAHRVMLYEASATIRSRTSPPRSWRARSTPSCGCRPWLQGAAPMCSRSGASTRPGACPTAAARTWWSGTSAPRPRRWRTSPTGQADPHGQGRDQVEVLTLATTFLEQGRLVDTCGGGPARPFPRRA